MLDILVTDHSVFILFTLYKTDLKYRVDVADYLGVLV